MIRRASRVRHCTKRQTYEVSNRSKTPLPGLTPSCLPLFAGPRSSALPLLPPKVAHCTNQRSAIKFPQLPQASRCWYRPHLPAPASLGTSPAPYSAPLPLESTAEVRRCECAVQLRRHYALWPAAHLSPDKGGEHVTRRPPQRCHPLLLADLADNRDCRRA